MFSDKNIKGLILAGGSSRRFGSDKRLAHVGGVALLDNASQTMEEVVGSPLISAGSAALKQNAPKLQQVLDLFQDAGPLAGIHAAMVEVTGVSGGTPGTSGTIGSAGASGPISVTGAPGADARGIALLVLACDLPGVRTETLRALIERFASTNEPILVCRSAEDGQIQPLSGVYEISLLPKLDKWLAQGNRTVMGFLDSVGFATMEVPTEELLNVNRPEDLLLFGR